MTVAEMRVLAERLGWLEGIRRNADEAPPVPADAVALLRDFPRSKAS